MSGVRTSCWRTCQRRHGVCVRARRGADSMAALPPWQPPPQVLPSQALCWGHCMQVRECRLRRAAGRLRCGLAASQSRHAHAFAACFLLCRPDGPRVAGVRGRAPLRGCGSGPPPGVSRSSTAGPCLVASLAGLPTRRDSAPGGRSMCCLRSPSRDAAPLFAGAAGRVGVLTHLPTPAGARRAGGGQHPRGGRRQEGGVAGRGGALALAASAPASPGPPNVREALCSADSLCAQQRPDAPCRCSQNVLGIILGGGAGTRLYPLTKKRAKPAVPLVRAPSPTLYLLPTALAPSGRPPCVLRCYPRTPGVVAAGLREPIAGRCGGQPGRSVAGCSLALRVFRLLTRRPRLPAGVQLPPD